MLWENVRREIEIKHRTQQLFDVSLELAVFFNVGKMNFARETFPWRIYSMHFNVVFRSFLQ